MINYIYHNAVLIIFTLSFLDTEYKIINKDPQEKTGYRQVLNLGHTIGHVLESVCKLPHGLAVAEGLRFSLNWSQTKFGFSKIQAQKISHLLPEKGASFQKMTSKKVLQLLRQDKKSEENKELNFIFLKRFGSPKIVSVSLTELICELQNQSYIS